jgi:hypothetical protein
MPDRPVFHGFAALAAVARVLMVAVPVVPQTAPQALLKPTGVTSACSKSLTNCFRIFPTRQVLVVSNRARQPGTAADLLRVRDARGPSRPGWPRRPRRSMPAARPMGALI